MNPARPPDGSNRPGPDQSDLGFDRVRSDLVVVPLSYILPAPAAGRNAVRASVDVLGAVSSVVLRPAPDVETTFGPEPRYTVVDGRRRIEAARDAGEKSIPALVLDGASSATADALALALNTQRAPSPIEEAEAVARLLERGYTEASLARLGISRAVVRKRLRLARAPRDVRDAVRAGRLAPGTAEQIANLPPYQQAEAVAALRDKAADGDRFTADDVRSIREAAKAANVAALPDDLFAAAYPDALRPPLGAPAGDPAGDPLVAFEEAAAELHRRGFTVTRLRDVLRDAIRNAPGDSPALLPGDAEG